MAVSALEKKHTIEIQRHNTRDDTKYIPNKDQIDTQIIQTKYKQPKAKKRAAHNCKVDIL